MDEEKSAPGPIRVLGSMSGTSLDGVDAAVLVTDGVDIAGFGPSAYRPYSEAERASLRAALGCWPGAPATATAARVVDAAHRVLLGGFENVDLIGFHGQTLAHEPRGRGTHQAGDGAALAAALGRPVVWDMRRADVAAGGEGAPLAPAYHWALARWMGARAPVAFVNLGGVGNLTWVDPAASDPFAPGALLAFDTGPANAPVNDLVARRRGWSHDAGGALAASGRADADVVARVLGDGFFDRAPPKSLDRDAFPALAEAVAPLDDADAAATLVAVAAQAVAVGLGHCPVPPVRLLVTGGGRLNAALMAALASAVAPPVDPVEAVGLDGDMLEAQAFAYLAARCLRGLPITGPGTTGVPHALTGGVVSWPETLERVKGIEPSS